MLKGRVQDYGIYLRDYDDITPNEGLEVFTRDTCTNYDHAVLAMSRTLFTFFDVSSIIIFEDYEDPIQYLDAYRRDRDGFGFLKQILKPSHPRLKDINEEGKTIPAPIFQQYTTIFQFINAYQEWLQDEQLRDIPKEYSEREQIYHVLGCLDDRFAPMKLKIEQELRYIYADKTKQHSLPSHLQLKNIGIYLKDGLPDVDINNDSPLATINKTKFQGRQRSHDTGYKSTNPYAQQKGDKDRKNPKEHTTTRSQYRNKREPHHKATHWADEIKWEILPNEQCPACLKQNHNVYKTGCPSLAVFCACQDFYNKTPSEKLKPVLQSYQQYQRELSHKMKDKRNEHRRSIKTLSVYDSEDKDNMKQIFFDKYKSIFPDEQYRTDNPYNTLDEEEDSSSDEE